MTNWISWLANGGRSGGWRRAGGQLRVATALYSMLLTGCGARTLERIEGETHWLSSCSEGETCGNGQTCLCGVCTATCKSSQQCSELSNWASCSEVTHTRYYPDCPTKLENASICVREDDLVVDRDDSGHAEPLDERSMNDAGASSLSSSPAEAGATSTADAATSEPNSVDSVCGDGVVGEGEACETDAEWCVACKVEPMVVGGFGHTCALLATGGVKCWGADDLSQLGNEDRGVQPLPRDVQGLTRGVRAITSGSAHTCALMMNGGVKCWGYNMYGQLGDGTNEDQRLPVDVLGLDAGVAAVMAGSASVHTCAVLLDGSVKCWGRGGPGGLGNGETDDQPLPVDVIGLSASANALALGQDQTCAILTTGGVECWGANEYGQLGDGTSTPRSIPGAVSGLDESVSALASANAHSCALLDDGEVRCWGGNYHREVNNGSNTTQRVPLTVDELEGVSALTVGTNHSCALLATGDVRCWGDNQYAQLGNPNPDGAWAVDVEGLPSPVVSLSAGQYHTCAWLASGKLVCWGNNSNGQLGNGDTEDHFTPVEVVGLP